MCQAFFDILICCLDIGTLSWRVNWKIRNPEFRRNSAVISPEFFNVRFFLNSKWLRWFSEECTSSEYTPKINRRLYDGFQSYPESPEFLKACFFNSFFFFYQDFSEECTSYEYIHQGLTENYPRVSEVTRRLPRNNRTPGFIYFSLIFLFYLLFIFNYQHLFLTAVKLNNKQQIIRQIMG